MGRGPTMNESPPSISTETAITMIADFRRRKVLRHLMENGDGAITIDELVAGIEDDVSPPTGATGDVEERLLIELHHTHLPKLAEAGMIDFDERSETIRYRPQKDIEALLGFVEETLEGPQ